MATATRTKPVTFIARATDLRVVADPEDTVRNHRGQIIEHLRGSAVEFERHRFEATEDDKIAYLGEEIPVVEFLRKHSGYNVDFWEVGNAPGGAKPTFAEQNAKIIRLLAEGNAEGIYTLAEDEKALHNRDAVLEAAEAALEALAGDTEDVTPDERTS